MIKTITVFKLDKKSHRGFWFTRKALEDYLKSENCKKRIENRTALGTVTHKLRKVDDNGVPAVDNLLLEKMATHTILKYFIEDGYLKADILIFDPDLFEGEMRETLLFLQGLIKSGVNITVSAGVVADYDSFTKEGKIIYDIVGVDFTLSPDFEEAGIN